MKINNILIQPVITEKTTAKAKQNVYTFEVNKEANKHQILETIEKVYGVEVSDLTTMIRKGKEKRIGRRMIPKKMSNKKYAYVVLKKGTIDLFPQS